MNVELYHCALLLITLFGFCICSWTSKSLGLFFVFYLSTGIMLSLILFFCVKVVKAFFSHNIKPIYFSLVFFLGGGVIYGVIFYLAIRWLSAI